MSDVIWIGAWGFLGPIFSLFIVDYIQGGDAKVAGIAATIYLLTKSVFQIPFASIIDRIRGEKDDFWILFIGSILAATTPILYLFIHTPMQLYFVQFVYGLTVAATFPSFMALTDFSSAIAASIGGVMAASSGFHSLIMIVVVISVVGNLFLIPIRPYMRLK
jgi:MFS family permease